MTLADFYIVGAVLMFLYVLFEGEGLGPWWFPFVLAALWPLVGTLVVIGWVEHTVARGVKRP